VSDPSKLSLTNSGDEYHLTRCIEVREGEEVPSAGGVFGEGKRNGT